MITSEKKAKKIFISCIDEMYRNSVPSITWKEILKNYTGVHDWQLKHAITEESYEKIKEKYQKKLHKMYHHDLDWFLLDYSPTFY